MGARLALVAFSLICYDSSQKLQPALQPLMLEILCRHMEHLTDDAFKDHARGKTFMRNLQALRSVGDIEQFLAVDWIREHAWGRCGESTAPTTMDMEKTS